MADLEPRRGSSLSRRQREQRAFLAVTVGGGAALVTAAGVVLALLDVVGWTLPLIAFVIAIAMAQLFRRTVGPGR
jgi:hypothetical protein